MPEDQPVAPPADPPEEPPAAKETRGRGKGRPFEPGNSVNLSGKAKPEERDPEGGVVTAARMRRVMGQGKADDMGPTEKVLRKWLDRDPKGFTQEIDRKARAEAEGVSAADTGKVALAAANARIADLERKVAELESPPEVVDAGSDRAIAQVKKLLREASLRVGPDGRCKTCGQVVPPEILDRIAAGVDTPWADPDER
jgi:hypothetical protein